MVGSGKINLLFLREIKGASNYAFDAEALVLSGLDYMVLSVDGTTSETYGLYRQGGSLDLAMDNMQRLVAAKKKHNLSAPQLSW